MSISLKAMVYGKLNNQSGAGIVFSRDPIYGNGNVYGNSSQSRDETIMSPLRGIYA